MYLHNEFVILDRCKMFTKLLLLFDVSLTTTRWGAYQPPMRLLRQGFVIVTINYRLGALGFLCLKTVDAPGNAGLKDQVAALYWVKKNIEKFGGNPHDVTVYGTESGAASVQLLLLSGLVKGLIHKVVLEADSVLSPATMTYEPLSIAYKGARFLGYEDSEDAEELYRFYQGSSAENLVNIPEIFLPSIENSSDFFNALIETDPITLLKLGKFHKVPMLITFTVKDSISHREDVKRFKKPPVDFGPLLPHNLYFETNKMKQSVGSIVKQFYFGDIIAVNSAKSYANYIHDILTEYPVMKMAVLFAAKNPHSVYVMKFTLTDDPDVVENGQSIDTLLDYLYRDDMDIDKMFVNKVMNLWKNFLCMGDPTPLTSTLIPLIWQPVSATGDPMDLSNVQILQLDMEMKMTPSLTKQRLQFWDNIYSRFYKPHVLIQKRTDLDDND